jgi:hypothetical protein
MIEVKIKNYDKHLLTNTFFVFSFFFHIKIKLYFTTFNNTFKFLDDELMRINRIVKYSHDKFDEHYQRHWLGFIRFQGRIIKVNANYGCFITLRSYEKLPENLRVSLLNFNFDF